MWQLKAQILRFSPQNNPQVGILSFDGVFKLYTLELPEDKAIPLGLYLCRRVFNRSTPGGMKIPITFEVFVPGHTGVLFHIGNTVADTHGCILVGMGAGSEVLYSSRDAFKYFLEETDKVGSFDLSIEHI